MQKLKLIVDDLRPLDEKLYPYHAIVPESMYSTILQAVPRSFPVLKICSQRSGKCVYAAPFSSRRAGYYDDEEKSIVRLSRLLQFMLGVSRGDEVLAEPTTLSECVKVAMRPLYRRLSLENVNKIALSLVFSVWLGAAPLWKGKIVYVQDMCFYVEDAYPNPCIYRPGSVVIENEPIDMPCEPCRQLCTEEEHELVV